MKKDNSDKFINCNKITDEDAYAKYIKTIMKIIREIKILQKKLAICQEKKK